MARPSGAVYLCKNALVDKDYNHTIDFKDPSEQRTFWGLLIKYVIEDVTYIRRQRTSIRVPYKLDDLQDVNYLFYKAEETGKIYYCFVDSKEYINDSMSEIFFITDVLQTYMFDYEIKPSYVLQEHVDRWDAEHKPIYSRTEEGLDYGSEYTVEAGYKVKPKNENINIRWFLAIVKPHANLAKEGYNTSTPAKVGIVNPYIYFLLPALPEDNSTTLYGVYYYDGGEGVASKPVNDLSSFINYCAESDLGNYVQQIVKLSYAPFNYSVSTGGTLAEKNIEILADKKLLLDRTTLGDDDTVLHYLRIKSTYGVEIVKRLAEMNLFEGIEGAMPTKEQWAELLANPYTTERDKRFESKLLTYPYRYNLLTDNKNAPIVIKNEYIGGDKIKLNHTQAISFNSPARYWIEGYKKDPEGRGSSLTQLVPEEAPVINDAYYTYMLENKNQLQADRNNAIINGISSTVQGVAGGGILGNMAGGIDATGGILGGISSGVSAALNYQSLVRSQNAKQKDLKNLPDTIINPNDANFSYFDKNEYVSFYRYKICCEFENLLADTFAMSGYTVKCLKQPNTRSRLRYNYIKTIGANIVGSFDQNDLQTIRAIYDKGVTFWHYNTINFKMLDYSLENIERNLLKG